MADAFDAAWNISKKTWSMSHEEQTDYDDMMLSLENAKTALQAFGEESYFDQIEEMMMELQARFAEQQRPEDDY